MRAGDRVERLLLVEARRVPRGERRTRAAWLTRCDCGTEKVVLEDDLKSGRRRSCGCWIREQVKRPRTHGAMLGGKATPEYAIWCAIKARCTRPNDPRFPQYGGRGIRVCQRWADSFADFLSDVGPRPSEGLSLDRIDNDGHYEPGNVRWATDAVQTRNTRRNRWLTAFGKTLCLKDWSKEIGVSQQALRERLRAGLPVERVLFAGKLARGAMRRAS